MVGAMIAAQAIGTGANYAIGRRAIRDMRAEAIKAARSEFNPNILNPQLQEAERMASEGINDALIREQTLAKIFGTMDPNVNANLYGGNAAAAVAGASANNANLSRVISQNELDIAFREDAARMSGIQASAGIRTQMNDMVAKRQTAIRQANIAARSATRDMNMSLFTGLMSAAGSMAMANMGGPQLPPDQVPSNPATPGVLATPEQADRAGIRAKLMGLRFTGADVSAPVTAAAATSGSSFIDPLTGFHYQPPTLAPKKVPFQQSAYEDPTMSLGGRMTQNLWGNF